MTSPRLAVAATVVLLALVPLAGCASSGTAPETSDTMMTPAITPVFADAGDLSGTTVDLVVGQALVIDTGDLPLDSYSAEIADPSVATFIEGSSTSGQETRPGVEAVAAGTTEVTLSNSDGGIEDVVFTVEVTD